MLQELLIIDDDPDSANLICFLVADTALASSITVLDTGRQALAYFDHISRDQASQLSRLVFLDLYMPQMSGWEFLDVFSQRYRDTFPNTSFCLLTSSENPQDKRRVLRFPSAVELFSKPFSTSQLVYLQRFLEDRTRRFNSGYV